MVKEKATGRVGSCFYDYDVYLVILVVALMNPVHLNCFFHAVV